MTKLDKAMRWISARGNLDEVSYPGDDRGFSKSTFYKALGILREEAKSAYTGPSPEETKAEPPSDPFVHMVLEMEKSLGLVELHYAAGELEIVQRRRIKVH